MKTMIIRQEGKLEVEINRELIEYIKLLSKCNSDKALVIACDQIIELTGPGEDELHIFFK